MDTRLERSDFFSISEVLDPSTVSTLQEEKRNTSMGTGWCRSCSCKGYVPKPQRDSYCSNCGHSYYNHE